MRWHLSGDMVWRVWGVVGPLFGIVIGQIFTRRWQTEHWNRENAKQECRELLTTMASTFTVVASYYALIPELELSMPPNAEEIRALDKANRASQEMFYGMLFIDKELKKRNIRDR